MSTTPVRQVQSVIVQVSDHLTDDDDSWTTISWARFLEAGAGQGQIIGSGTFEQTFGVVTQPNDPRFYGIGVFPNIQSQLIDSDAAYDDTSTNIVGALVRFCVSDDGGEIQDGDQYYTDFWYGQVDGYSVQPNNRGDVNAGGTVRFSCSGLAGVLDQITVQQGWLVPNAGTGGDGSDWVDPGFMPPFNSSIGGDRSADTVDIGSGTCYIHDLSEGGTGNLWTASQIVQLLLYGCAQPPSPGTPPGAPMGWGWNLSDPDNVLGYIPERLDLNGLTVLQAINTVINIRRGASWFLTVSDGAATINVVSGYDEAITVGGFSLPASTDLVSYTAAGNPFTSGLQISRDSTQEYDIIEVRGNKPWVGISLGYDPTDDTSALAPGWSDDEETQWNTTTEIITTSGLNAVYRLFQLSDSWDFGQWTTDASPSNGIRNHLGTDVDGDFEGTRDWTGENLPTPSTLTIERTLPTALGVLNYSFGPRQGPMVFFFDDTVSNSWVDMTPHYGFEVSDYPVGIRLDDSLSSGAPGFGRNTAFLLQNAGSNMVVTVGIRENQPLRVNWTFDQSTWPRQLPRMKMIDIPDIEQWIMLAGTVVGVNGNPPFSSEGVPAGTPITISGDQVIRDNTDTLQAMLALAVVRYGYPTINASWTEMGILDTGDIIPHPGTFLQNIITGNGSLRIGAIISRITWRRVVRDGVDQYDTSYETQRVLPEIETVR